MTKPMKYFLAYENDRNTRHAMLYIDLLKRAFGDKHEIVLVGHHFVCEPQTGNAEEDLKQVNEIPSADTILFDHEIMTRVFGDRAVPIMVALAKTPCDGREAILRMEMAALGAQAAA